MIAHALKAEGFDASEDGTGRGIPLTVGALTAKNPTAMGAPEVDAGRYMPVYKWPAEVAPTLNAHYGDKQGLEDQHALGGGGLFVPVAFAIQERAVSENPGAGPDGVGVQSDQAYTLEARQTPQAVAFDTTQITSKANYSQPKPGDPCHPLAAHAHAPAVATPFHNRQDPDVSGDVTHPLGAKDNGLGLGLGLGAQVRRLTPKECARLQGFPDDYLDITYRGKPTADGPKYKALGNSFAVPVVRWIGERIGRVEAIVTIEQQRAGST